MGLNDEAEKLRQAGEWLKGDPYSEQFKAAWEHVHYVIRNTQDPALCTQAQTLLDEMAERFAPRLEELKAAHPGKIHDIHGPGGTCWCGYGHHSAHPSPWRPWERYL